MKVNPFLPDGEMASQRPLKPFFLVRIQVRQPGRGGETGIHARLKILWPQGRAGSIPALGTSTTLSASTSGCGSVGRALRLGRRGPRFESEHPDQAGMVQW